MAAKDHVNSYTVQFIRRLFLDSGFPTEAFKRR
jgi:hypothetical protein